MEGKPAKAGLLLLIVSSRLALRGNRRKKARAPLNIKDRHTDVAEQPRDPQTGGL